MADAVGQGLARGERQHQGQGQNKERRFHDGSGLMSQQRRECKPFQALSGPLRWRPPGPFGLSLQAQNGKGRAIELVVVKSLNRLQKRIHAGKQAMWQEPESRLQCPPE